MGLRLGLGLGVGGGRASLDVDALSYFSRAGISSSAGTPTTYQNASTFNGTNQSLTVASNSSLQIGGSSFSYSCWFNPAVSGITQTLIQKTASGALEYSFGLGSGGGVRGLLGNAGSSWAAIVDVPFTPSAGRWTHAVWTFNGTSLRIYINGVDLGGGTASITTSGTAQVEIGRENGAPFNGSISSVGFWKRALSASEVTSLFNSGAGRTYASLDSSIKTNMVSWWDLSETSGNRADSFGSNTLTNNNSVGTTSQGVIVTATANSRALIIDFVKGVKNLGLWNNFVCWPLRSSQNAGTGTTAFSLGGLGTFNGTLVNGPTWGVGGITTTAASSQRLVAAFAATRNITAISVMARASTTDAASSPYYWFIGTGGVGLWYNDFVAGTMEGAAGGRGTFWNANNVACSPVQGSIIPSTSFAFQSLAINNSTLSGASSVDGTFVSRTNTSGFVNPLQQVVLGCRNGNTPFELYSNATHSGFLVFNTPLSNTAVENIRSLYKASLGVGLGLP